MTVKECYEQIDGDYEGVFALQCHVAETDLWETEHNARFLACLEAVEEAWRQREA